MSDEEMDVSLSPSAALVKFLEYNDIKSSLSQSTTFQNNYWNFIATSRIGERRLAEFVSESSSFEMLFSKIETHVIALGESFKEVLDKCDTSELAEFIIFCLKIYEPKLEYYATDFIELFNNQKIANLCLKKQLLRRKKFTVDLFSFVVHGAWKFELADRYEKLVAKYIYARPILVLNNDFPLPPDQDSLTSRIQSRYLELWQTYIDYRNNSYEGSDVMQNWRLFTKEYEKEIIEHKLFELRTELVKIGDNLTNSLIIDTIVKLMPSKNAFVFDAYAMKSVERAYKVFCFIFILSRHITMQIALGCCF